MKQISEQIIEVNHLKYSEAFCDSVREHPFFQFPLHLKTEPSVVSANSGELFLITEYVSYAINSLRLNIFYVHKYIDNRWVEILAIPHARKVRLHGNSIYTIIEQEENRYRVTQYDLSGHQIQCCTVEDEADTQINLDSIYFTENCIVYCYQYFLEQLPNINRERYTSSSILEWREDTEKNLLSVYAFSSDPEDNQPLWTRSLNKCGLKVRWKNIIDESKVYEKDLGVESFHQIVTLLHGDVMQICYTDENISNIMPEDEYWYQVCFVYPDGTVNDYAQAIGKVKRNPFNMEKEFSDTNHPVAFFSGVTLDDMLATYRVKKDGPPELVCSIPIPTTEELNSYVSQSKHEAFSALYLKAQETAAQIKRQEDTVLRVMENTDPLSQEERMAENMAFQAYLDETQDDLPEENMDDIFGICQSPGYISAMKWRQRELGISALGVANDKLFYTSILMDYPNTVSLCAYFDILSKERTLLEVDIPWKSYLLGNITNRYFIYVSGHDTEELGCRNGSLIMKRFSGEVICTLPLDSQKDCIGFIAHEGVLHILYKDRQDPMNPMNGTPIISRATCLSE